MALKEVEKLKTRLVLLALSLVLGLLVWEASAYGPPEFDSTFTQVVKLNGHGEIIRRAVEILRADGYDDMARLFEGYLPRLYWGAYQADQGGSFEYLGVTLGRNYFSHFHEASTGKGFYLTGMYSTVQQISFDWKVSTMRGPHASGADMVNYYYARAVEELRGGSIDSGMEYLGYALHVLADLTVPHHAGNIGAHQDRLGETMGGKKTTHGVYEDAVDNFLAQNQIVHASSGGIYHLDWLPSDYAVYAASQSAPHIGSVKYQGEANQASFLAVANVMVPLAERLSAGLLRRFFEKWKNEDFTVAVLRIDRVKALGTALQRLDTPDEADFYVKVRLGSRQFPTSCVIEGGDEVEPNVLSEYNWFYPLWVGNRTSVIPIEISLWDDDGVTGDDHADIDPRGGQDLDLEWNLGSGSVTGDTSASFTKSHTFTVSGKNTLGTDRAEIKFTLWRYPSYPPGSGPDLAAFLAPTILQGMVSDDSGNPVAGATLRLVDTEFETQTSEDGTYQFPDLTSLFAGSSRSRSVKLQAEKDGYSPKEVSVTLKRGETVERPITLTALPQTRLKVILKGENGENISGATLTLKELNLPLEEGETGQYLASFQQPESTRQYTLEISAPGYTPETRTLTLRQNVLNTFSVVLASTTAGEEETEEGETQAEETGPTVRGTLSLLSPSQCDIRAAGPISGWWWLRGASDVASFTFTPPKVSGVSAAALNFVFLVTNRANGGSGFTTHPRVEILDGHGNLLRTFTLNLFNPFRPRCESDTQGVGYEVRGFYESQFLSDLLRQGRPFTVRLGWPFPGGMHLAANCNSVVLAYVVGGRTGEEKR